MARLQDIPTPRNLPGRLRAAGAQTEVELHTLDCEREAVGEMVAWVDESNHALGEQPRARLRAEGLRHRASYIFVFDRAGNVLLQRRSQQKDLYPGWFDACAGGVLRPGETYIDNARREILEELGIRECQLDQHDEFYFEEGLLRVFGASFVTQHEGPFAFTDDEVDWAEFVPVERIFDGTFAPLTPDSVFALRRLRART